ncbi:MAG: M48 family metalloprotease [Hyphomicrobiales bacterium]|nr:M48 family metalloprotease [Hyphomicrobiales bacterium]MCP5372127.1 M48 family metalloprotease [Hyphomicrobiales bacterium]
MIPARPLAAVLAAAALTAACVGNPKVYDDSVRAAQVMDGGGTAGVADESAAQARAVLAGYQVASLSPGQRPAASTVEAGLWMQIDRVTNRMQSAGNRVTDPALNAYVAGVVCRVAGEYCNSVRTYVLRQPAFNAAMYPNGVMEVWSGLLLRVRNEAQLAAVVGHEVGHYLRRHSLQRFEKIRDATNGLVFFQVVTAMAGVGIVGNVAALATIGGLQAYSRDNEREADGYGLVLMGRAGYDPREAAKVWANIQRETDASDNARGSLFAASHPPSDERQRELARLAPAVTVATGDDPLGRERFLAAVAPHRMAFLRDEIKKRTFKPTMAMLEGLLEDGDRPAEIHYAIGELYRIRGDDGDGEKALDSYAKALADGDAPAAVHRSVGLVHRKAGRQDEARAAFARYLELTPQAEDAAMIRFMIQGGS